MSDPDSLKTDQSIAADPPDSEKKSYKEQKIEKVTSKLEERKQKIITAIEKAKGKTESAFSFAQEGNYYKAKQWATYHLDELIKKLNYHLEEITKYAEYQLEKLPELSASFGAILMSLEQDMVTPFDQFLDTLNETNEKDSVVKSTIEQIMTQINTATETVTALTWEPSESKNTE